MSTTPAQMAEASSAARRILFKHVMVMHDTDVSRFVKVPTPDMKVWHRVEHQTVELALLKHVNDYLGT